MLEPKIEIVPSRIAVRSDASTTLDVLVRVVPPQPEAQLIRPPLNLGLVIDRSGSMQGQKKMEYARQAAAFAVEQLLPTDRVSVTIFDSLVETIAANALAVDRAGLIEAIRRIEPRSATDLHAGWEEGCRQVVGHLQAEGLNRVLLLSDGLANQGVTDPGAIAGQVKAMAAKGVSTTTMGLGDDYNEDLMQAMGVAGDGNYYYIESPVQLTDIFQTELKGLMACAGQKVSLGIEPMAGASVVEVLNELERNDFGRLMLPNLVAGMPIPVVARLKVPALASWSEIARFRLAWDDPRSGQRQSLNVALEMDVCTSAHWETLPADPRVAEQVAILMGARARKEAVAAYDRGDLVGTRECLAEVDALYQAMPPSPVRTEEMEDLARLSADLQQEDGVKFRKRASWQNFQKHRGRKS